jgi:hypothetical protein
MYLQLSSQRTPRELDLAFFGPSLMREFRLNPKAPGTEYVHAQ